MPQTVLNFIDENTMIAAMEKAGCDHVSYQIDNYWTIYGQLQGRVFPGAGSVFLDLSGNYLVDADQDFLDLLPPGRTLNEHVDPDIGGDPSEWQCWLCGVEESNGTTVELYLTVKDLDKIDKKLDKDKVVKYKDEEGDKIYIFGCQATIPYNCSSLSKNDILRTTIWWGDEPTLSLAEALSVTKKVKLK